MGGNDQIGDVSASIEGTNADGQVLLHAAMSRPFRVIETGAGLDGYEPTCDLITEAVKEAKEAAAKANASVITDVDVTTLGPGSEATVSTVKGESGQTIKLGIPQGPKGDKGDKGDKGGADYGVLNIDDDGYLNAHYTTDMPSIKFELDGNDLRTVLEIADN